MNQLFGIKHRILHKISSLMVLEKLSFMIFEDFVGVSVPDITSLLTP